MIVITGQGGTNNVTRYHLSIVVIFLKKGGGAAAEREALGSKKRERKRERECESESESECESDTVICGRSVVKIKLK